MFLKLIILLLLGMIPGIQSSKCQPETSISPCVCDDSHSLLKYDCDFSEGNSTDFFEVKGSIAKSMKETNSYSLELRNMRISRLSNDILAGITLTSFRLTDTDTSEIDKDAFKDSLNSLTDLQIRHSNLTKIPIEAISNLRKLVILWISFSSISSIAKSEMDKLPTSILSLGLRYNKISTIDPNAFDKLVNLKNLWLDSNMLTSFSNTIPPNYNKIKEIGDNTWSTLPVNSQITLKNNDVTALPKEEMLEAVINKKITVNLESKGKPLLYFPKKIMVIQSDKISDRKKKDSIKIATWNVRTLYQKGKLDNVNQEMDRMNLNILGLSEVRWTGAGSQKINNKTFIYSGGTKHERGTGILFDEPTARCLKAWCPISDRVIVAKLEAKPLDIGIIQVYAPTSDSEDEEVERFYEEIDRAKAYLKSQDIKIVMGDFNAKVGNQRVDNTVGPWGIGTENERGSKLIEWCQMNDFTITNTWFQNHPRRQWTWMSPGDRTRNKIDFILIQKRFRNAIKSSKSLPGADCDTDHVPVRCTFQIKLKILKKPKNNPKYQINLLKSDKKLKDQFYVAVKNKFETLESITEAEELWNKMKDLLNDSIKENIPKINKKEHKKWMSKEILDLMEERRKVKNKVTEYKNLNRLIKRKCNNAKENWINEQCQEIEHKKNTDSKYMHSKIKDISGIKSRYTSTNCIKSKEGIMLMEKEDILNRWSEYVEELFMDNRGSKPELIKNIDGPPILEDEVKAAMRKMKHGKATGPDNIPIEAISALEDLGIKMTTKFLNLIYDSGKIPDDLCKSVFITIPKTPGATECALHRTISLMSHFTKILLRVLMIRMRKSLRPEISKTQFGFVSDKGTRNAIFTLSMLMERCVEVQKDLYLCSIDYSKAFDKTYVWSVLLYGCECWTFNKEIEKKLEATEMWLIRRMMRISWTEKRTNDSVLKEANVTRSLIKNVRRRQLEFLGHICRQKDLEYLSITGKIEGKRSRGRQRTTFIGSLNTWTTQKQYNNNSFLRIAENRSEWRTMIANVCPRQGT
ncbi:Craniofacial development protein 2 [Nymphon striatum]|nr:Craniofacial development protein 2 [Nymphon striatum]